MFGTSALLKECDCSAQQLSTPRLDRLLDVGLYSAKLKSITRESDGDYYSTSLAPRRHLATLSHRDLSSLRRYFYRVWAPTTHSHTAPQSQACRTPLHVIVGIRMLLVLHQLLMTYKCDTVVSVFDGSGSEIGVITLAWPLFLSSFFVNEWKELPQHDAWLRVSWLRLWLPWIQ